MIPLFFAFHMEIAELSYILLLTLRDMLKDLFLFIFESILDLIIFIIDSIGYLFEGLNIAQYFSALPPEVVQFANYCSLGECLGIIITAITIRILLQLIPFTRLGS